MPERSRQPHFEFHVSRDARARYGVETPWFALSGNVLLDDLAATRRLAHRMNAARGADARPERAVHPGELHALGLVDEILHLVAGLYREQRRPDALRQAFALVVARLGEAAAGRTLRAFLERFPPLDVHLGRTDVGAWLAGAAGPLAHAEVALEELLMLWLANVNPAFEPFRELFDDAPLAAEVRYGDAIAAVRDAFAAMPPFGPDHQALPDMLRAPALAHPRSITGQLEWIRERWAHLLPEHVLRRLLVTLDVIREEERGRWARFHGAPGLHKGTEPVPDLRRLEAEPERFTPDRDWMPRVVMIAKSTHVWLDQLSRWHGREIRTLDRVPDEELDTLARRGINALWLIGLWERSRASAEIKHRSGNPEAAASAYSLHDYVIAADLGGEAAWNDLRERAARRGLRLASDMVPNHTGLDSRWMIEHPDWFIGLDHPPYPSYTYEGPDLSSHPDVEIKIEDHYWDRSDAAVTFRRRDRRTGHTRYVYHGNDGTHFPWNDTAQLDYLNPAVREAVLRTILEVARRFPIIRFDAAMTLAKRHYQRLWFPEPGSGGGIPSRAERGLTRAEFDAAMPEEFWREVVDRVAAEAPDTLLLAEAFWLMEGYFVRSLGMHRVYNSAFMNMLRDEQNANYRSVIKNTLEFDPEILKRYVNFMNNPDERTAVDQFGKGDKYFAVCTLMATLPGLPMFGHGQIEGFAERYGMEFRRAQWDERPDGWLIERHAREIFPLLHRRSLFAEARDFLLYDLFTPAGHVNEDVFAYSNREGEARALVVVHNRHATTAGWIRTSAAYAEKVAESRVLRQRTLAEGLGLPGEPDAFAVFRDHVSGLEYVRSTRELHDRGLFLELGPYARQVFLDWRVVRSTQDAPWAELARALAGRGVADAGEALDEMRLRPLFEPLRALLDAALVRALAESCAARAARDERLRPWLDEAEVRARRWLESARAHAGLAGDVAGAARALRAAWAAALAPAPAPAPGGGPAEEPPAPAAPDLAALGARLAAAAARALAALEPGPRAAALAAGRWNAWRLARPVAEALAALGAEPARAARLSRLPAALLRHGDAGAARDAVAGRVGVLVERWLADVEVRAVLDVHEHEGVWWVRREAWLEWTEEVAAAWAAASEAEAAPAAAPAAWPPPGTPPPRAPAVAPPGAAPPSRDEALAATVARLRALGEASGWRADDLARRALRDVVTASAPAAASPRG
uniref:Alpha-amylase n=1 Tax=Eiseniibacteriota bacterium TaxID=2212470 RepID=A0A832I6C0_UNCEI